jgi:hypothetical protein
MGTEMVDLYVGDKEKHFRVHKKLLCSKVPYFDNMFNGSFAESQTDTAKFPEDGPIAFDILQGWLYTGRLRKALIRHSNGDVTSSWCPCEVYSLAEKLCLPSLMNELMDQWVGCDQEHCVLPVLEIIARAYIHTSANSEPRRYVSRVVHYLLCDSSVIEAPRIWPTDEIHKLMMQYPALNLDVLRLMRMHTRIGPVEDPRNLPRSSFFPKIE